MATTRTNKRLQVGSQPWIEEERASALQMVRIPKEDLIASVQIDVEWLDEHMRQIFSENDVNIAETMKTPAKLRGKTPRTARKVNPLETRPPLTDVFSSTPRGQASPFKQAHFERPVATFQVAEDEPSPIEEPSPQKSLRVQSPIQRKPVANYNPFDSGYFGSQSQNIQATQATEYSDTQATQVNSPARPDVRQLFAVEENVATVRESTGSFKSAEEQVQDSLPHPDEMEIDTENAPMTELEAAPHPVLESPLQTRAQQASSPQKRSPQRSPQWSPERSTNILQSSPPKITQPIVEPQTVMEDEPAEEEPVEDVHSQSDGSSPIRPIVRKSSLNFASLPAREPITTKKSLGARTSRTSHLDQNRTSYYGRATGGKSLGNLRQDQVNRDDDDADIDMEDDLTNNDADERIARLHNKTSTQRLQDQISKLGQSQTQARPASKSIVAGGLSISQSSHTSQPAPGQETAPKTNSPQRSPDRKSRPPPGAFPDDEEDSWIGPPTVTENFTVFSPRPQLPKSHTTDVMEGIHRASIAESQFSIPKRGEEPGQRSPVREPIVPERTTSTLGHIKSVSTSVLRSPRKAGDSPGLMKTISVSNPTMSSGDETQGPPKSPSRSYRGSPLKAAKDKFSSIMKTSRSLFASSAAVSADAKTSTLTPSSTRFGNHAGQSMEDVFSQSNDKTPLYPILDNESSATVKTMQTHKSPPKAVARKTRASTEREERQKEEEARQARDAKEAQKMADQLEKARLKEQEKARVFHQEQERVAVMQKEVDARKEQERQAKASHSQVDLPRATRSSPRKTKAQLEAEGVAAAAASNDDLVRDTVISDASAMPPPAIPRPKSQIGRPGPKRPLRPAKETLAKAKPPTVIKVDMQRGHPYHPSNSTLAATLQESLSQPSSRPTLSKKASTSSIASKASVSSFKATASRAIEAAARKKELDEIAAQRKRQLKEENEKQRAAIKEEERRKEEQQRKQEAERQREMRNERERVANAADAKKAASRQATEKRRLELEKAKQVGAPPPATRNLQDKALPPVPREAMQAKSSRQQEEMGRPASQASHNVPKPPSKRPLQQEAGDDNTRPGMQRNGPSYEQNTKRRKTSENFDDDDDMTEPQPRMNAPPIRQSSSRPKDNQPKSLFPSGYSTAPSSNNLQRSTILSQHNLNHSKPAHPMDMAQMSKGPIPFASSTNQQKPQPYKTPIRPGNGKGVAKSAAKSSPQYQNGESIDLPEINTDSEDDDDEDDSAKKPAFKGASWIESPALRKALTEQENIDPATIFGQANEQVFDMEQVFNKSKDKFSKFRDRTSSANWFGTDGLTDEEIQRDVQAKQRMNRAGGWEYNSMV